MANIADLLLWLVVYMVWESIKFTFPPISVPVRMLSHNVVSELFILKPAQRQSVNNLSHAFLFAKAFPV